MRNLILTFLAASFCNVPAHATFSSNGSTGSVTPTELVVTFTGAYAIDTNNKQVQILATGSYPVTFKKTDADMSASQIGAITIPVGRYIGLAIGLNFSFSVMVNGEPYRGNTAGSISGGTKLYSIGTDARANNAIATSGTAVVATDLAAVGTTGGASGQSQSYFATPICVTKDGTGCQTGDIKLGDTSSNAPNLYVMMDLYNCVAIDTTDMSMAINNTYPVPTLGAPGAAMHMQSSNGGEWMAIFGPDKSLIATRGFTSSSTGGVPSGGNYVTVTAGPTMNSFGPTTVSSFDSTKDVIKTPMGDCPGSTCTSSGLLTINGMTSSDAGSTLTVTCSDDTTGALGYTYTGANCTGHGNAITVPTYKLVRIADPTNLFGHCSSSSPGYQTGGTCVISTATSYPGGYY